MALTERSRAALFRGLSDAIENEEAVGELLSFFPARDVEEPVTKEFLRAEMADLRAEMADLRAELKGDMADLRAELKGDMADLRAELKGDMADLRAELKGDMADLRAEQRGGIAGLRAEMHQGFRSSTRWTIGFMVTLSGVIIGASAAIH